MSLVESTWIPKEISRRPMAHYDARLTRSVDSRYNDLDHSIGKLEDATSDFIDFIPLGQLSLTLTDLSPIVKRVLNADKKGNIEEYSKKDFEEEIAEAIEVVERRRVVSPENTDQALGLFGRWKDRVGIRLRTPDPLLIGERIIAERYIKDNYNVSPRFASEDIMEWEPHITLGYVRYEKLGPEHQTALQANASDFLASIVEEPSRLHEPEYTQLFEAEPLDIPDIALGGLRVVCNKLAQGIY